jgi:RecB family exonuclease
LGADDLAAADVLERILLRLRGLDSVLAGLTRRQMAELLEAELDAAPSRVGRIGSGVQVGPLAFGVGQPLDVLVVVGAAEGLLPAPPARSGLLSDADRALIGDDLPPATAWPAEQRRHLAAALAGAARAVVCSPRGDLRGAVLRVPSRLIDEWAARTSVTVERRASFVHTVAGCTHPPTVSLARAGALVRSRLRGHDVRAHALVDEYVATRHGVALLDGRAATTFTEYDGMIGTVPFSPSWATATTLERWAKCPYAFFLREVLGVQETVDPAQVESILPTDRGALVHGALDDLHRAVLDGQLPQPVRGWTREHAEVLEAAFRRRCDEAEATGLTGYPALWAHERDRQWDQLVRWLAADGELLVDRGATVLDSEWRVEGAELSFPSGVTVSLRGNVDRIDLCPDRLVITDHKSGKVDPIDPADPTQRGTRLQLPLYGLAARHHPGVPEGIPISVEYSSLSTGSRPGLDLDDRLVAEVHTRVQHIVDSIAAGIFIALPPAPSGFWGHIDCPACDPDGLGTASAHRRLLAKQGDPAVAAVLGDLTHDEQAVPT